MRNLPAVLAVIVCASAAGAVTDYFPVTMDGSFDTSVMGGYGNAGGFGTFKLYKSNQNMGFMSWAYSGGDHTRQSLPQFLANHGGSSQILSANLHFCALGQLQGNSAVIVLRCANDNNLTSDYGSGGGSYGSPSAGIGGATEAYAWRSTSGPFSTQGDGLAEPWARPTNSTILDGFSPGQPINFLGLGWNPTYGRWALQYVIGCSRTSPGYTTISRLQQAGQLLNSQLLTPGNAGTNPRGAAPDGLWYQIPLDSQVVNSLANDTQSKGLVFWNYTDFVGGTTSNNNQVYSYRAYPYGAYIALEMPETSNMTVTPSGAFASSGVVGGPLNPTVQTYSVSCSVEGTGLDYIVSKTQPWITLSSGSGSLTPGQTDTITITINSQANVLAAGKANDTITFTNSTNHVGDTTRSVTLTIDQPATLDVAPTGILSASGLAGGPFSPSSVQYTIKNTGTLSMSWTAAKTQSWVSLSDTGGTLAGGASKVITVSIGSEATGVPPGTYLDTVTFTNTTNHTGNTTRSVSLTAWWLGDVNHDGHVDVLDLMTMGETWARRGGELGYNPDCDLNGDATINVVDLLILAGNWGR